MSSGQKYNQGDSDDRKLEYSQDVTGASERSADLRRQEQEQQEQRRQEPLRQQQSDEESASARLRKELEQANHALAAKNSQEGMAAEERKKILDDNMELKKMISDLEARVSRIDGEKKIMEDELMRSKRQSRRRGADADYGQGMYDEYSNRENVRGGARSSVQDMFGGNVEAYVQDHDKLCAIIQKDEEHITYLLSELDRLSKMQLIRPQIAGPEDQVFLLEARGKDTLMQESTTARRIEYLQKRISELENRRNYLAWYRYGDQYRGQNFADFNDEELHNLNGFIATARRKLVEGEDRLAQLRAHVELLSGGYNMLQERVSTSETGDHDETVKGGLMTSKNTSEQQDIEFRELARILEKSEEDCKQLKHSKWKKCVTAPMW